MRVVVADDAVLLREGLVRILADDGYQVVAAVGAAPDLIRAARNHAPDLVVTDIRMPPNHIDDGIAAARQIRAQRPSTAIVLLSQYIETTAAVDLFQDNPAGLGYLLKDRILQIEDFLDSVRRVAAGGSAIDPAVVAKLVGRTTARSNPLAVLTDRETAALALMAEGLSNSGIAARLHVGVRTVETYTSAVFAKLDIPNGADEHRRVKAVLAYLSTNHPQGP
ncbi:response regulator transcription factor [Dactylosporangium sp. NPDC049525]|uniref:response regulator transcription factor n=1 Tax=Dactylosporangium sp. NPDC049525 TaxID=3154730 RepID=UPI003449AD78